MLRAPPKRGRLTRSADFERVYRQGRSHGNRYLVLYAFPRAGDGEPRLGLSVSRRSAAPSTATASSGCCARRSPGRERLPDGHDVVVVARPDVRELAEREGLAGVRAALAELSRRPGRRART